MLTVCAHEKECKAAVTRRSVGILKDAWSGGWRFTHTLILERPGTAETRGEATEGGDGGLSRWSRWRASVESSDRSVAAKTKRGGMAAADEPERVAYRSTCGNVRGSLVAKRSSTRTASNTGGGGERRSISGVQWIGRGQGRGGTAKQWAQGARGARLVANGRRAGSWHCAL